MARLLLVQELLDLTLVVSDLVFMLGGAIVFGLLGLAVSHLAHRLWWKSASGIYDKAGKDVGDTVSNSILALIAFLLALIITNELGNFGAAARAVTQESLEIHRVDRDLQKLGAEGEKGRQLLSEYVSSVVHDEWARLSRHPQSLSPDAGRNLEALWAEVRAIQASPANASSNVTADLDAYMQRIEEARLARMSASLDNIPDVVWLMIGILFLAAWVLHGRHEPTRSGSQMWFLHMGALGLMLALIVIIDNPFGGDTSVDPAHLVQALDR